MQELIEKIRQFIKERDWEQFHSPKNLVMALNVEVAEIMEHLQWLTEEESRELPPEKLAELKDEIGDVFVYLIRLCDELDIDLLQAAAEKMTKNAKKYPVEQAKGNAKKYTEY
ncbi:MAG: nucleotide pyrophosphohydrolase [Candidatus Cloacimonas sp. SDB]|nr:MAG: nucleotide pyrophosphohydrolase [Candidatus Cloacimonas sp. SDB]